MAGHPSEYSARSFHGSSGNSIANSHAPVIQANNIQAMSLPPSQPIYLPGPKDFYVEVLNDDRSHGIIVAAFDRFQPALNHYEALLRRSKEMRLVMRHGAHIYRNHIPERLHNSYDRSREYPM